MKHPKVISTISSHLPPNPHDEKHMERRSIALTFDAEEVCTTTPDDYDPFGGNFADYIHKCYEACAGLADPAAELAALRRDRDMLAGALQEIVSYYSRGTVGYEAASAALAASEGRDGAGGGEEAAATT